MVDDGQGYWQNFEDEPLYPDGNIDPQLLASGTWATPHPIEVSMALQLEEEDDLGMHSQRPSYLDGIAREDANMQPQSAPRMPHPTTNIPNPSTPMRNIPHRLASGMVTPASSSHSLHPQAVAFRPSTGTQEHFTRSALEEQHIASRQLAPRAQTPSLHSAYGTPLSIISDSEQRREARPAFQHAQLDYHLQALQHTQSQQLHGEYIRSETHLPFQGFGSSSQAGTMPIGLIPSADHNVWESNPRNLAPVEDIESWTQETYAPAASHDPGMTLAPPREHGRSSRQRTASNAGSTGSFLCPSESCQKNFDTKSDLDHHERYHRARKHPCTLCSKTFVFPKDLKRHIKTHNPGERHLFCTNIGCPYHTKGFQRSDHLKRHMQSVHGAPKTSR